MTFAGTLLALYFYITWLGGCTLAILMLLGLVFSTYRAYILAFLTLYYSFRYLVPRQTWPAYIELFQDLSAKYPYFRSQKVHFEDATIGTSATTKTLFAFHPHGILGGNWLVNGIICRDFRACEIHWLVFDQLKRIPFTAEVIKWLRVDGADKATFVKLMKQNKNIAFIPGGFEEATLFEYGVHCLYLKKRFGFIKLALMHGYQVVPVYSFGEEFTVQCFTGFKQLRVWLNRYKIPTTFFIGRWSCFFLPKNDLDMNTVIGKPVVLPQISSPTPEDIQKYHSIYMNAVRELFDRHKAKFAADPNVELKIV
ncbi:diacylglycerol acyltransferase [Thraustotheca clavata]|uniref:Acyltransferase n=1 Tax=Thraustotheca clavata TaxID=74557 RepID=A0A1W0A8M4_9STRA|nr:diacylglycerol acyltransferase [Thraustotheca clavata]